MPNTDIVNLFSQRLIDLFPKTGSSLEPDPVFRIAPFLQWLIGPCPKPESSLHLHGRFASSRSIKK
ncbi:hypothetical protein AOQ84DRAFT_382001 [Glonium stellatum]|uniref:Uncharacterized protein n=1 Tax=Glonium stellatum TaxID=574774 RepID=A0A8E2ER32_9PEZI|nr:hypothetical protein AOQ84DRAFT_382001 [Glonium stellatum]